MLDCALAHWHPGDPGSIAWVTVAVYAAAALLSVRVAVRAPFPAAERGRERAFWLFLALAMGFLSVNKELDLQALMAAAARCAARAQGWYDVRRVVQVGTILALVAAVLSGLALLFWLLRGTWRRTAVPFLGLVFAAGFALSRAVRFHHVDALIGMRVQVFRGSWLLEVAGPLLIALSALVLARRVSAAGWRSQPEGPARGRVRGRGRGSRRLRG